MIDEIEIIGFLAATLTTIAFIPQVYKIIKSNSTEGISLVTYMIFIVGVGLWLVYGLLKGSISMILGNGITFFLAFIIICYIFKNKNSKL
jgi:MtN3 and saliva related transmembrane protein